MDPKDATTTFAGLSAKEATSWRTTLAALAIIAVLAIAAPASGATAHAGAYVETSATTPVAAGWTSLSCPTATFCLGVAYTDTDDSILQRSTDGGAVFTYIASPTPDVSSVACATASFCVALTEDDGPDELSSSYVTADGGAAWTHVALPGTIPARAYGVKASCSTATCYLVAEMSDEAPLLSLTPSARSWTAVELPSTPDVVGSLNAIGCGGGRCVATGVEEGASTALLLESDAGGTWTETEAPTGLTFAISYIRDAACSAYACVAFGTDSTGEDGALLSSTSSGSWQAVATAQLLTGDALSCTTSNCIVAGGNWDVGGLDAWELSGVSPAWTTLTTPTGEDGQVFEALACPSASTCLVGANRLYSLDVAADTWGEPNVLDGTSGFASVSCGSATACVTTVQLGDGRVATRTTTDAGLHWHGAVPIRASDGFPYGLDCLGSTCMADGYDEATNTGWVARSTDDGRRWALSPDPQFGGQTALLTSMACATALVCVANSDFGFETYARTTDGGASWNEVQVHSPAPSGRASVTVVCSNATTCLAISATAHGELRLLSHNAGASWSYGVVTPLKFASTSISCVADGTCLLAGALASSGEAIVLRSTNDGLSWSRVGAPKLNYKDELTSVSSSCWTSTSCEIAFAGKDSTRIEVTTDGGKVWNAVGTPANVEVATIACSASTCVGTGSSGPAPVTVREANPIRSDPYGRTPVRLTSRRACGGSRERPLRAAPRAQGASIRPRAVPRAGCPRASPSPSSAAGARSPAGP
jgi:hypothetical protein